MRAEKGGKGGNDSEQRANKPHKQGPGLVCVVGPCLSGQAAWVLLQSQRWTTTSPKAVFFYDAQYKDFPQPWTLRISA
eukprot:1143665-Pelagomonas_calceolata.AAC.6